MIEELTAYSLFCDDPNCNNYYDGEIEVSKASVIKYAETDGWLVKGEKCYCPEHRPNT